MGISRCFFSVLLFNAHEILSEQSLPQSAVLTEIKRAKGSFFSSEKKGKKIKLKRG